MFHTLVTKIGLSAEDVQKLVDAYCYENHDKFYELSQKMQAIYWQFYDDIEQYEELTRKESEPAMSNTKSYPKRRITEDSTLVYAPNEEPGITTKTYTKICVLRILEDGAMIYNPNNAYGTYSAEFRSFDELKRDYKVLVIRTGRGTIYRNHMVERWYLHEITH